MNGLELFLLGRKLMKIGEEAIPTAGLHDLPASVRSVLIDVFEHPNSSISEITARTGFPQSHVSASVARLHALLAVVTAVDPKDHRRTLVLPFPKVLPQDEKFVANPIDSAVAAALGSDDHQEIREVVAALEALAARFIPEALLRIRSELESQHKEETE